MVVASDIIRKHSLPANSPIFCLLESFVLFSTMFSDYQVQECFVNVSLGIGLIILRFIWLWFYVMIYVLQIGLSLMMGEDSTYV